MGTHFAIKVFTCMKMTLSLIKADIGGIGGHTKPSEKLLETVRNFVKEKGEYLLTDHRVYHTGDDVAILMTHTNGEGNEKVHQLAWDAFVAGTETAKSEGLYGAGQDLLKDAFTGNIQGMGPGVAEIEFEERPNESVMAFSMDKTEPGAFNLPMYLGFADPMWCPGLIVAPEIMQGFTFEIIDTENTEADKVIRLHAPEDLYDIAALLRETRRYVVKSIYSRKYPDEHVVSVSTTRLKNIAGKYVGKDDPVALVRVQKIFPATEEIGACYRNAHFVAGDCRGSHQQPLMPVTINSPSSVHYCVPIVQGITFSMRNGILTEFVDVFDDPFWDHIREKASRKSIEMREQGFVEPSMLPREELEYGGIGERLDKLESRFEIKPD
jgi:fructose 1,6-bisphosphate aldolase/phosphatase